METEMPYLGALLYILQEILLPESKTEKSAEEEPVAVPNRGLEMSLPYICSCDEI